MTREGAGRWSGVGRGHDMSGGEAYRYENPITAVADDIDAPGHANNFRPPPAPGG